MNPERVDFLCNLCGRRNLGALREQVENRDTATCAACHSSLRMRALVHALGAELFGSPRALPAFPVDKSIRGAGMSDWEGYALRLAERFDYTNTFYHCEPRLDIANIPGEMAGTLDFLISSDVFEHIPPQQLDAAFANAHRLLKPAGLFLFTVPFEKLEATREHFPRLNDFRVVEEGGARVLHNTTVDGEQEVFRNLVFHGGEGMTLEMRMFSERDLMRRLQAAGFASQVVRIDHAPHFGITWPIDYAVPIVARA